MIWTPAWRQLLRPIKGRTSLRPAPAPRATITSFVSGISPLVLAVLVVPVPRLLLLLPCQKLRLPDLLPLVILWPAQHELESVSFTHRRRAELPASGPRAGPPEAKKMPAIATHTRKPLQPLHKGVLSIDT